MATPARTLVSLGLAILVAMIAAGASGFDDETENYERLRAMPRERRANLVDNLERFDRLGPGEQAALRKLDQAIARKDPVDRARYRSILRRYHLWVSGLSDDRKKKLEEATDPGERFSLARKFRLAEADDRAGKAARVSGIRTGDYGLEGPSEASFLLQIWNQLTPKKQAEIGKRGGAELRNQIRSQAKATGVHRDWSVFAEEGPLLKRLESDPDFKQLLGPMARRAIETPPKKAGSESKTGEAPEKRADLILRRLEHPFTEFLYYEDHPVRPVDPKNLERFVAACPAWFLGSIDPLNPDDARNYLSIVYRRIYPHPAEFSEPGKDRSKVETPPRPASRKAQTSPPPA